MRQLVLFTLIGLTILIGQAGCFGGASDDVKAGDDSISAGLRLYREKTCNTCHGETGTEPLLPDYPIIAQLGEEYALKQMKDIKSGARDHGQTSVMKPIIEGVSDDEMAILAKFIDEELGRDKVIGGQGNESLPGAMLYKTKTCLACHGEDGRTPLLPEYAKVAGQSEDYVVRQLKDIKSGARDNGTAVEGMKAIMNMVSEEEMEALAEYISSLPR